MFPILDSKGMCVAFGGRVMDDSTPKYLNSSETEAYVKGRHLYGMFQGRKAIREADQAIVVEGYMDLIACHQAGVQNVAASCGTALTTEQARLIRRSTNNVVMLYDADKAGEAATLRGLEIFLEEGMDVKIVRLPEGHDPDSYVRQFGAGRFRSELAEAKTLFEYKLSLLKSRHDTATLEGKVKVANEMVALFQKVKNEILCSAWIRELSKDLSLPEEALVAEMRKGPREAGPRAPEPKADPTVLLEVPLIEKQIVGVLLELPVLATTAREELRSEDFKHPLMRKIAMRLLETSELVTAARLITFYQEEPDAARVISLACAEADILADKKKAFADCIAVMKRSRFKNRLTGIRLEMAEAERVGDRSRLDRLMRDFNELNRGMRQIDEKK
jgi:DNA primase